MANKRCSGITILGAITSKNDNVIFHLGEKTNKESVMEFLEKLKTQVETRAVIVMDNHQSHHTDVVKEVIEKIGLDVLYLPLQTSELNPIERVWSILKRKWADKVVEEKGAIDIERAKTHITSILSGIKGQVVRNLARNDFGKMIQIMKFRV